MDPIALLRESGEFFIERLDDVPDDAWENPTPCPDWNVRAVASHVVHGLLVVPALLSGERPDPSGRGDDRLGEDPIGSTNAALDAAIEALDAPGALGRPVVAPAGQMPAGEFAILRAADTVIHTWDMSVGAGLSPTIPPSLVAEVTAGSPAAFLAGARQAGVFGPEIKVAPDADPQTALLALYGRRVGQ
jgi:uncharacterized protein (TIGR03086 family)